MTTEREVQQEQRTPSGTSTRGLAIASFGVLVLAVLVLFAWPRTTHDSPPPPVAQHIVMPRSPSATGLVISGAPVSKPDAAFEDAHVEAPAAAPTSQGCGREPGHPGRRWLSELVGLTRLKWLVYVPKGYDPNQPAPVILTFHGSYHGAPALLEESQIEPIADERGFVLIAFHSPDAEQRWEREPEGFVAAALQATGDELCLDMSRVFGLGHGTGGMFVRRLACEMHLSAMATVSSGQWDPSVECSPEPPIPYLRTAGRNDPYFPFGGGLDCREYTKTYSVAYIEDQWRQRNKCGTDRTVWRKFPTGVCYSWDCEAPLVSCHHDGGYQWPGIAPDHLNFVGCPDPIPTFPLAQTVVSFFEEQGRHRDP